MINKQGGFGMGEWQPMATAPKDGREILARRHNDVCHEHYVVWWSEPVDSVYPWRGDGNAYPEHRLDEWMEIPR